MTVTGEPWKNTSYTESYATIATNTGVPHNGQCHRSHRFRQNPALSGGLRYHLARLSTAQAPMVNSARVLALFTNPGRGSLFTVTVTMKLESRSS